MEILHIDIETYSDVDIKKSGAYAYIEHDSFEILLFAYAFGDEPIVVVDLANLELIPDRVIKALENPAVHKYAHNAVFERLGIQKHFYYLFPKGLLTEQWYCTAVKASSCGLPLSLEKVSTALKLNSFGKSSTGRALIKYFCVPCKPTKANNFRTRNYPEHDPKKWEEFKLYCVQDVVAERQVYRKLKKYKTVLLERVLYIVDQEINDTGVLVDISFAIQAEKIYAEFVEKTKTLIKKITGVNKPGSDKDIKEWLSVEMQKEITSIAKDKIGPLIASTAPESAARRVLKLRSQTKKTSIAKYSAMQRAKCRDNRLRGLFQFEGAERTSRWAGRIVQAHNLPRNYLQPLKAYRELVASGDVEALTMMGQDKIPTILSELIRTAFIAPPGKTFGIADFSAIEARIIAWIANEVWRLDVFNTHGKIYEASASMMFNVPIEDIVKGGKRQELRAKGKVAELALGFGGGVRALARMGGEKEGMTETEMQNTVDLWRAKSPAIVRMWKHCNALAMKAIRTKSKVPYTKGIYFDCDDDCLMIFLPSGRKLAYREPKIVPGRWGKPSISFMGTSQLTSQWSSQSTYGGKLTENIVQAVARDILGFSLINLQKHGFKTVMHIHDEVVVEISKEKELEKICNIMAVKPSWATGLPLGADGYISPFYKKD